MCDGFIIHHYIKKSKRKFRNKEKVLKIVQSFHLKKRGFVYSLLRLFDVEQKSEFSLLFIE